MSDPYQANLFQRNPFAARRSVQGELVALLSERLENRGLELMLPISRVLCRGEIHELIVTSEGEAGPGKRVDRIGYLGFFEVLEGGVIVVGDEVQIGGKGVGAVAGFDATHLPNHINIVLKNRERATGIELGLKVGDKICFRRSGDP